MTHLPKNLDYVDNYLYPRIMEFEWDEAKDAANVAKHGLSFAQAALIFDGPIVSRTDDRADYGELRIISYGALEAQVIVAVVHTNRKNGKRVISARLASAKERKAYYEAF